MTFSEATSNNWQKNLYAIFVGRTIGNGRLQFCVSVYALVHEKLGNYSSSQAAFWAGIAKVLAVLPCFYPRRFGLTGRPHGQKTDVLRLSSAARLLSRLLPSPPNVPFLVIMRFFQGVLSGTVRRGFRAGSSHDSPGKRLLRWAADDGDLYRQQLRPFDGRFSRR